MLMITFLFSSVLVKVGSDVRDIHFIGHHIKKPTLAYWNDADADDESEYTCHLTCILVCKSGIHVCIYST